MKPPPSAVPSRRSAGLARRPVEPEREYPPGYIPDWIREFVRVAATAERPDDRRPSRRRYDPDYDRDGAGNDYRPKGKTEREKR